MYTRTLILRWHFDVYSVYLSTEKKLVKKEIKVERLCCVSHSNGECQSVFEYRFLKSYTITYSIYSRKLKSVSYATEIDLNMDINDF